VRMNEVAHCGCLLIWISISPLRKLDSTLLHRNRLYFIKS